MDSNICEFCRYWSLSYFNANDESQAAVGECRRRSPVLLRKRGSDGCFPIMAADEWCGEWRAPI